MRKSILYRGNVRDLGILLALISAYFFPATPAMTITALVLLALGTLLHVVTKATLIRNAVLCREGVYRICRHPYYLSNLIVDMSLCLLSGNIYLVLAYPFLFFWAYGPNLRAEETRLASIYKQAQYDFLLEVPQIFPAPGSVVPPGMILKETSLSRVSVNECSRIIKFWGVALALIAVHILAVRGGRILNTVPVDVRVWILIGAAAGLLLLGFILQRLSKEEKADSKDGEEKDRPEGIGQ
jgi:hypothetical protein